MMIQLDNTYTKIPLISSKPVQYIKADQHTSSLSIDTKIENQMEMTPDQQQQYDQLIDNFKNSVFRPQPGLAHGFEGQINIQTNKPVLQRTYPLPVSRIETIKTEINRMIQWGIIERSRSPWSNPMVPVYTKSGEIRLCLDARKLNQCIIPDRECPEPIESTLTKFRKNKYISTLDLRSGYTAFLFQGKNYQYRVIPFELSVSESQFAKCLQHVLEPLLDTIYTITIDN